MCFGSDDGGGGGGDSGVPYAESRVQRAKRTNYNRQTDPMVRRGADPAPELNENSEIAVTTAPIPAAEENQWQVNARSNINRQNDPMVARGADQVPEAEEWSPPEPTIWESIGNGIETVVTALPRILANGAALVAGGPIGPAILNAGAFVGANSENKTLRDLSTAVMGPNAGNGLNAIAGGVSGFGVPGQIASMGMGGYNMLGQNQNVVEPSIILGGTEAPQGSLASAGIAPDWVNPNDAPDDDDDDMYADERFSFGNALGGKTNSSRGGTVFGSQGRTGNNSIPGRTLRGRNLGMRGSEKYSQGFGQGFY